MWRYFNVKVANIPNASNIIFDFDASNVIFIDLTSKILKLFDFDASDVIFMDLMLKALKFFEVFLTKKHFQLKFF